jgi:uncharacterized membrane protein
VSAEQRPDGPGTGSRGAPRAGGADATARHVMDPVERTVRRILIAGIAVSVALMAIGLVLGALDGDGLPSGVVPLARLASRLGDADPAAYLSLGLIVLIATPFVRVAASIVVFALEGDRRYTLITAVVLGIMCVSVVLGKA